MKSTVYFAQVNSNNISERINALRRILKQADSSFAFKKGEFVPVKLTIGDADCVYQVSPELVKAVVLAIKEKGAKPFLFDTSVIYTGARQNAVDHLNLAQSKGYGQDAAGAPFIIADGVFGQDGKELEVVFGNIKKIKVPSFVGMLDSLVVLSHVTGHIVSVYAGALKNVAMGMSCRATKQVQHSSLKPSVIEKKCTACGCCIKLCPAKAIKLVKAKAYISQNICIGCAECICACKFDAIYINWEQEPKVFCQRMAEVASVILEKFKHKFFINFALDITKECDCISDKNELMVAENLGILASSDPLSLDKATVDLITKNKKGEFFKKSGGVYGALFQHASENNLGNLEYNLISL